VRATSRISCPGVTYVQVPDSEAALGTLAANFFGRPAEKLNLIGITGTNGKTSVATLLHSLFNQLGYMSGLVSTIRYLVGKEAYPASHTTPNPIVLHRMFAKMVEMGCEYCFMEVSSHALVQQRTVGLDFSIAVFTNITHDHLDYHGTFARYIQAKKLLFDNLSKDATALINLDDRNARVMVQNTRGRVRTFALRQMADYRARIVDNTFEGLHLEIDQQEVWVQLVGSFNAYNVLSAYAVALELGLEKDEVLRKLSSLGGIEGRFESVRAPKTGLTAIVDYAHTPDALKNVLTTIVDVNQNHQQGKVITVVGCGGDRDREKRPKMSRIAAEHSDQVILTSDNPRSEPPEEILKEMEAGLSLEQKIKALTISDRKEAIRTAVRLAQPQDVILVAGKGHETYQEIQGVRHPFDDREVLRETFINMNL
jgi:UDP-N-acetylmuramoyl-L-alanyl-D-glutamate--2,6-diaminopimelate ligase